MFWISCQIKIYADRILNWFIVYHKIDKRNKELHTLLMGNDNILMSINKVVIYTGIHVILIIVHTLNNCCSHKTILNSLKGIQQKLLTIYIQCVNIKYKYLTTMLFHFFLKFLFFHFTFYILIKSTSPLSFLININSHNIKPVLCRYDMANIVQRMYH